MEECAACCGGDYHPCPFERGWAGISKSMYVCIYVVCMCAILLYIRVLFYYLPPAEAGGDVCNTTLAVA